MTTFTDDDIGKRVESATGERIGTVANVDRETAYVDPAADAVDSIKAVLDWDGGADTVPLADDAVGEITDEAVRLEAELPTESIESNVDADAADAGDSDGSYSPGTSVESSVTEPGTDQSDPTLGTENRTESTPETGEEPAPDEPAVETDAETRTRTQPESDEEHHAPEQAEPADEVDPMGEMEDSDAVDPETQDPIDETGGSGERVDADELESVEEDAGRDLEVDPTELTDGEPEAEIRSREDVGDRTDAEVAQGDTAGVDSETERPNPGEPGDESVSVDTATEAADESDDGPSGNESETDAGSERSESDADEER